MPKKKTRPLEAADEGDRGNSEEERGGEAGQDRRGEEEEEEEEEDDADEDDGDGDGDGDGGEEDVDDEDNQWRFGKEIDLLALAEGDESGAQPYQQFERLEYEALAARRRRATTQETRKQAKAQDLFGVSIDDIREAAAAGCLEDVWEASGFGSGARRGRKRGRGRGRGRGRRRKSSKTDQEVSKKLGEANLAYATSQFEEALALLKEVVRLAPNMPEPYHVLGLVYNSMGNRKKAISFYMLAAHLTPKDISLWKRLASWSMEEGSTGQVIYCLKRAMKADSDDVLVKWELASLLADMKDYVKAAEIYEAILMKNPGDVEVCKMVAKMRHRSGSIDDATKVLRNLMDEHPTEADLTAVNLLTDLYVEKHEFSSAITCIEQARGIYCAGKGLPLDLAVKAGICHAHLGNFAVANEYFEALGKEQTEEFPDLVIQVGDAYKELGEHQSALHYYGMLRGIPSFKNTTVSMKMVGCHVAIKDYAAACDLYSRITMEAPNDVHVRMAYASLLLELNKMEEALNILVPAESADSVEPTEEHHWWLDANIIVLRAKVYYADDKLDSFLEHIVPLIHRALEVELHNQKIKGRKRLSKRVLVARVKHVDEEGSNAFIRSNPLLSANVKLKAARARKALAKLEAEKDEKRAAALAAGFDWQSEEDSEPEATNAERKVQPLPKLFDDEEHYQLLVQTCKTLMYRRRYGEALELINNTLKVGRRYISTKRLEIISLGAEITFKARDGKHGYECVRYIVQQQPYSLNAWNWYYQAVSSSETRVKKHGKFMLQIRAKYPDCVPAMLICGHQFSMISQPQGALREYLQAYKLQPEDPFVCLCVGVAFINLSLGFRLRNRNQCVLQGFAFLHKYNQLSEDNQESNYNLARAYHHAGFVTIAVKYYDKVLSHFEKDHSTLELVDDLFAMRGEVKERDEVYNKLVEGRCDLRREAAYNLHLIYKKSGALDLARKMLQDFCAP